MWSRRDDPSALLSLASCRSVPRRLQFPSMTSANSSQCLPSIKCTNFHPQNGLGWNVVICGLWSLWLLETVKENHRVVEDSEHNMLQRGMKWTANGEDVKMIRRRRKKWDEKIIEQKIEHESQGTKTVQCTRSKLLSVMSFCNKSLPS